MAEFTKISSFIDLESTGAEKEAMIKMVQEILDKIKSVGKLEVKLTGTESSKEALKVMQELSKATKDQTDQVKQYEAAVQGAAKAEGTRTKAVKELTIEQAKASEQTKANNKNLRDQAKEALGLTDEYGKLSKQYEQAARTAQNLIITKGRDSEETKKAVALAQQLGQKLKDADADVLKFGRNVGNYTNSLAGGFQKVADEIAKLKQKQAGLQDLSTRNPIGFQVGGGQKDLDDTTQAISRLEHTMQIGFKTNQNYSVTVRQLEKDYQTLATSGTVSNEFLKDYAKFVAEAKKESNELKENIKALASETRGFDLVSGAVNTVVSSFQAAAGAAALFGANEEETQKVILKLVAVQNIATGVREIANEATKRGTALNLAYAGVQRLVATALDETAAASKRLYASLGLIGLILTVVGAVVVAIVALSSKLSAAEKSQKALRDATNEANEAMGGQIAKAQELYLISQSTDQSLHNRKIATEELIKMVKENNERTGEHIKLEKDLNGVLVQNDVAINALTDSLYKQAYTKAFLGKIEEAYTKLINAQTASLNSQTTVVGDFISSALNGPTAVIERQAKKYVQGIDDAKAYLNNLKDVFASGLKSGDFDLAGAVDDNKKKPEEKSKEDFKKGLNQQIQERVKALNDFRKADLAAQAQAFQDIANDESKAFSVRQDAFQSFYEKRLQIIDENKKTELADLDAGGAEQKRQLQQKLDTEKNLTKAQRKDIADTIAAIDKTTAEKRKLVEFNSNTEILNLNKDYDKQYIDFLQKNLDTETAARLKAKEEQMKQATEAFQGAQLQLDQQKDIELGHLQKTLKGRLDKVQIYEQERLAIEKKYALLSLQNQLAYYTNLLERSDLTLEEREAGERALFTTESDLTKALTDIKLEAYKTQADAAKAVQEAEKRFAQEAFDTVKGLIEGRYDAEKNAIQGQIDLLEQKKQKDIEVARQTSANAAEAADKIVAIEASAATQKEALQRRQREVDFNKAKFERLAQAASIIGGTAQDVAKLSGQAAIARAQAAILASNPLTAAFAPAATAAAGLIAAQIPIVIGIGALNLAKVLATPIPKYGTGLKSASADHLAFTGDAGRHEVVKYKDGSGWITPNKPTLTWIPKGAEVIPSLQEAATVYRHMAPGLGFTEPTTTGMEELVGAIKKEGKLNRRAIAEKKEAHISIKNGQVTLRTLEGYNESSYLNQNLNF